MSPDKRTINQLNDLRKKAEKALAQSDGKDWTLELIDNENLDASNGPRILEELRVYQAELEIQNLQLRESELQAQQESQRYLTLFDSMPMAVLVVDHAGVVIEANLCAAELFSFRGPQRLLRHSLFRLFDAESSL
jgi:PAS domain-containing protein